MGSKTLPGNDIRVVQWATGNIGTRALRAVIEHPGLQLAGLYVHSPDKAGRDAGELAGIGPVGVPATGDLAEITALGAQCVLYMPARFDADEVCALLESGANVVTTCGEFHRPAGMDPALRDRVEKACAAGGASVYSTGSSPGFITEALPLVLTSIQRRLDRLAIDEYADLSQRDSPDMLFNLMGFGQPMAEFDDMRAAYLGASFGPSLRLVADAIGIPIDEVAAHGEFAATPRELTIAAGTLAAGTVAAQRVTVDALRDGEPVLRFRANWYCTKDVEPAWDLRDTGWHISLQGDTPLEIDLVFPIPLERMAETSPGYTAHRAVNAVAAVVAAPPGIRTTVDLPQVIAQLG
ncbi:dihydrodipicolinate reductase [Nocardia sp. alder85J]|uniref:NAD(P)H-dependent amine dehydrogenase family protein n=1 Tax=Nocardia sp. alder85J TaxID=2862949 RepID=UPI001CD7EC12|nr:dihydrodipicolinate reductase [Nocardia sp. alder85J]MCX4094749.1 dihydrodipicolinate reductase [Nocardia sp. alder85J]